VQLKAEDGAAKTTPDYYDCFGAHDLFQLMSFRSSILSRVSLSILI
jgi:hypothetical protein